MSRMSGSDWMSDGKKGVYDEPVQTSEEFEYQQGKPIKALIGIALLVVLAVALARRIWTPLQIFFNLQWGYFLINPSS